jgi:hypothetical protein
LDVADLILAYDCVAGDPGYDFLVWLVEAEMQRRHAHAAMPLQIAFAHADRLTAAGQRWMSNVWRPLLPMLGAAETAWTGEPPMRTFLSYENMFNAVVEAAERGEAVPLFHARPGAASGDARPVVITLRECDYSTHRNSNLDAWLEFAQSLQDAGERVIIVRDTAKSSEPLEGFCTFPPASYDVRKRLALYEQAKMNFFVSNGPVMLAAFSDAPYCYLMTQYAGSQGPPRYPWAKDNQRIFYLADTVGNLAKVWEEVHG